MFSENTFWIALTENTFKSYFHSMLLIKDRTQVLLQLVKVEKFTHVFDISSKTEDKFRNLKKICIVVSSTLI